jgi:ferredoxin
VHAPDLVDRANDRGFVVIGAHSLRMPEDYPPMIALRMGFANQPGAGPMRRFESFLAELSSALDAVARGAAPTARRARTGLVSALLPVRPRTAARADMGEKHVDPALCTRCRTCERGCPYGAIRLDPLPVFDMERCFGCWRCYNRCPEHAISTARFTGGPFYAGPPERARKVLGDHAASDPRDATST